jgi:hypothetical protein
MSSVDGIDVQCPGVNHGMDAGGRLFQARCRFNPAVCYGEGWDYCTARKKTTQQRNQSRLPTIHPNPQASHSRRPTFRRVPERSPAPSASRSRCAETCAWFCFFLHLRRRFGRGGAKPFFSHPAPTHTNADSNSHLPNPPTHNTPRSTRQGLSPSRSSPSAGPPAPKTPTAPRPTPPRAPTLPSLAPQSPRGWMRRR